MVLRSPLNSTSSAHATLRQIQDQVELLSIVRRNQISKMVNSKTRLQRSMLTKRGTHHYEDSFFFVVFFKAALVFRV